MSNTELDLLIRTRRDLHRHPEVGYQEHRKTGTGEHSSARAPEFRSPTLA